LDTSKYASAEVGYEQILAKFLGSMENPQKLARRAQSKGNAAFFDGKYVEAIAE